MSKQIPENVHKSPKFDTVEVTDKEENTELEAKAVAEPVIKFKTAKKKASVNYREPLKTDRPKNVYIELIDGEYWLWYNTERSQEVGISRNMTIDDRTQIKSEYGYDCNIPATKENIALLKKEAFAGTNYMFKDSVRRTAIDIDKFIEEAKL